MKNQINLHEINWNKAIITVLVIAVLFLMSFALVQCEENKTATANIDALNSEITTYKLTNGQLVSSKQSLELTKLQLEDLVISKDAELEDLVKHFSKIKTITKVITEIKIDTIEVPFAVEIPCDFERYDLVDTKHYSFNYNLTNKGFNISNLKIPDSLSIVTGTKRKWFLGKETHTIDITHSNPNIKTTALNHYEITNQKKWYQKDVVKMTASVVLFEVLRGFLFR